MPNRLRSPHTAPLLVLGLALWIVGGLVATQGPESGSAGGVAIGVAGIASVITGVALHLRAGGR